MTNIKKEIKREVINKMKTPYDISNYELKLIDVSIKLTQKKMIKEFKEMIYKCLKKIKGDYFYVPAELKLKELKQSLEEMEKAE